MRQSHGRTLRDTLRYLLGLVALTTVVGAAGFQFTERGVNPNVSGLGDSLWWALVTITTVGYGDIAPITVGGRVIASLMMAIGIGIVSVATATFAAYLVRFDPFDPLRARRLRDHTVICGLGEEGLLLARRFKALGEAVAVVERDEDCLHLGDARDAGAIIVIGDATDPQTLARARVARARNVVVACGDDRINAEIAARLRPVATGRARALTCAIHIVDPHLWALLRQWELAGDRRLRLSFFHVDDIAARAMLDVASLRPPGTDERRHLLVVGPGRLARHLMLHAARDWWLAGCERPLRITLFGEGATAAVAAMHLTHVGLERIVELHPLEAAPPPPGGDGGGREPMLETGDGFDAAFICLAQEPEAVSAALQVRAMMMARGRSSPIVLRLDRDRGLGLLVRELDESAQEGAASPPLRPVGTLDQACHPDLVLGGATELLARAAHAGYVAQQQARDVAMGAHPAMAPWDDLPPGVREANRRQAEDAVRKLASLGYHVGPLTDWSAADLRFPDDHLESLSRLEHERWLTDRLADGWTVGPRDAERKRNPHLVPWSELPEAARETNRQAVRDLPRNLFRAGLQVVRGAMKMVPQVEGVVPDHPPGDATSSEPPSGATSESTSPTSPDSESDRA